MTSPLEDWVIVQTQGLTLIGRPDSLHSKLSPFFELSRELVSDGRSMGLRCMCAPLMAFTSLRSICIPPGALIVSVSDLSGTERDELAQAVAGGERMLQAMRAAQSGIVMAGPAALGKVKP